VWPVGQRGKEREEHGAGGLGQGHVAGPGRRKEMGEREKEGARGWRAERRLVGRVRERREREREAMGRAAKGKREERKRERRERWPAGLGPRERKERKKREKGKTNAFEFEHEI
jgi:hypothetical protein